ncbi:MAG TPA: hypothetical protein VNE00_15865 [Paraburkholderia sp.]|jgi:hypothetical protein|nr:hypothetical protein [Paraburkholderia sp.]
MPDSSPAGEAQASEVDQLLEVYALTVTIFEHPLRTNTTPIAAKSGWIRMKFDTQPMKKAAAGIKPAAASSIRQIRSA